MVTIVTMTNEMMEITRPKLAKVANLDYLTDYIPIRAEVSLRGHFITNIKLISNYNLFKAKCQQDRKKGQATGQCSSTLQSRKQIPSSTVVRDVDATDENQMAVPNNENFSLENDDEEDDDNFEDAIQEPKVPGSHIQKKLRVDHTQNNDTQKEIHNKKSVIGPRPSTSGIDFDQSHNQKTNGQESGKRSSQLSTRPLPPLQAAPRQPSSSRTGYSTESSCATGLDESWQTVKYNRSCQFAPTLAGITMAEEALRNPQDTCIATEEELMEMNIFTTLSEESDTEIAHKDDGNNKKNKSA